MDIYKVVYNDTYNALQFCKKNKNNVIQKTASQLLTVVEGVTYMRKI